MRFRQGHGPRPTSCLALTAAAVLTAGAPSGAGAQSGTPDSLFRSTRGVAVVAAPGSQYDLAVMPDGAGGLYLAWVDDRAGDDDIYVQRITSTGRPAPGWSPAGVAACRAARGQYAPRLASDGKGGVFVAWDDLRGKLPGVFVQHVTAGGQRNTLWPPDGIPVCSAEFSQRAPAMVSDGAGGVIVAWEDGRGAKPAIVVQRIANDATIEVGWPTNGIAVTPTTGGQSRPRLVSDGVNGALVLWEDARTGTPAVYAHRITWRGLRADSWPSAGLALSPTIGRQDQLQATEDGAGGTFVAWRDHRRGTADLLAVRVRADGTHDPSWPVSGVSLSTFPSAKDHLQLGRDETGGFFAAWQDERSGDGTALFVQRMGASGHRAQGWPQDGRVLATTPGYQVATAIVPDGNGGVFGLWQDFREGRSHLYGQYLDAGGTIGAGWPAGGLRISSDPAGQIAPRAASDGAGGVIVAWEQGYAAPDLYASRLDASGIGASAIELHATDVDRERVRVVWRAQAGASFETIVQRRTDDTDWADAATRVPAEDGTIEYEDRGVTAGARYGYRLARPGPGGRTLFGEVWVETPDAPLLALAGMTPNPARGDLTVAFSLPAAGEGLLELYDVAGRRVRFRDLATLGPGRHTLDLGAGDPLPPGFYLVRLHFAGQSLTARGTVIQ